MSQPYTPGIDPYDVYVEALSLHDTSVASSASTPTEDNTQDGWRIDKTYAQVKAMYDKGLLHELKWHKSDGSIAIVPLSALSTIDSKSAFVFSGPVTDSDGTLVYTFVLNEDDDLSVTTAPGNGLPEVTEQDKNKVLVTDSDGNPSWGTVAGGKIPLSNDEGLFVFKDVT